MLDRFIGALPEIWQPKIDYELYFPKEREYESVLRSYSLSTSDRCVKEFNKQWILGLPLECKGMREVPDQPLSIAAKYWWEACLHVGKNSKLTFPMIGRLAELILRINPKISNALRSTYTHVFMDEFQDTTHVQYDLVKTAFLNSQTILTAVGDKKQLIMRWAMALEDAFEEFEKDFQAQQIQLSSNYRSSSQLVEILNHLALIIDTNYQQVQSKVSETISEDACVIWDFHTPKQEAEYLAKTILDSIRTYKLIPEDFVILVKQKADTYETFLKEGFRKYGLKIRVTQQDMLAEPLTAIFISFLRFGSKKRAGIYWSDCYKILANLQCVDLDDDKSNRLLQEKLNNFHYDLHDEMKLQHFSKNQISKLLKKLEEFINKVCIQACYLQYKQDDRYDYWFKQISNQLKKSYEIAENQSWESILDNFEGKDSVSIMTVHKSKGSQYHTVIFVGLEDSAWWSFSKQPKESRSNFFVAFSRAKQRVIFTYCKKRGERDKISSLYEVLLNAGVKSKLIE
jgi:superfamily I DNA/RNA helicase